MHSFWELGKRSQKQFWLILRIARNDGFETRRLRPKNRPENPVSGSLGFSKSQNRRSAWEPVPCRGFKNSILSNCLRNIGPFRRSRYCAITQSGGPWRQKEREQHGKQKLSFRCSDVGPKNCDWQISGSSEADIMPKIEQHGREKHNMKIDDETRKKVHSAIHGKAA